MEIGEQVKKAYEAHKSFYDVGKRSWDLYATVREITTAINTKQERGEWWSVVQTVMPHLFFRLPPIRVVRKLQGARRDPISIKACEVAERTGGLQFDRVEVERAILRAVENFCVCGRGVPWIGYEPKSEMMRKQLFPTIQPGIYADAEQQLYKAEDVTVTPQGAYLESEELVDERIIVESLPWRDFLHSGVKESWDEECEWVARAVYITEEQVKERFPKKAREALRFAPRKLDDEEMTDQNAAQEVAKVWEVWDKTKGYVCYLTEQYEKIHEEAPPLKFRDFFPCPAPLVATYGQDGLIPVADYYHVESNLQTLATLTSRYRSLANKLRIAGVYNAAFGDDLYRALDGTGDELTAIKDWPGFVGANGFDGNIALIPMENYTAVLQTLSTAIIEEKQRIFEKLGVSDLMRGQDQAMATATAQGIKAAYGNVRLSTRQRAVSQMVASLARMVTECAVEMFDVARIAEISGSDIQDPDFQQALELLRSDEMRTFALDINTDDLGMADEEGEKGLALEFAEQFGILLQSFDQALAISPTRAELHKEVGLLVLSRFRAGRQVESRIDDILTQEIEGAKQAQEEERRRIEEEGPPPPPPEVRYMEAEAELALARAEAKRLEAQITDYKMQLDSGKHESEQQLEGLRLELQRQKLELDKLNILASIKKIESETAKNVAQTEAIGRGADRQDYELAHEISQGVAEPTVSGAYG